jgi:membrane protease YdiL (CAAX protease family)
MRRPPTPAVGLVVFLLYLVFFYGVWIVTDVEYADIGDSADTLLKWYVGPTWVGGLFLIVAVTWLGWWRPVLYERERARPRWIILAPAYTVLLAIAVALFGDFSAVTTGMWVLLFLGSLGVGFAEEVSSRGVLIAGFRARLSEPWVWFLSCLLFGLLHLPNWVFGSGPSAAGQVLLAFGVGSTFYLLRRFSGTLLWCMGLHAFWDSCTVGAEVPGGLSAFFILNAIIGLVVGILFIRRERGRRVEQAGAALDGAASVGS